MSIEDIINEECVNFMTEEPMDNIQSAEYFKENILPDEIEITHDDGNYFEFPLMVNNIVVKYMAMAIFITLLPSLNYWRIEYDKRRS